MLHQPHQLSLSGVLTTWVFNTTKTWETTATPERQRAQMIQNVGDERWKWCFKMRCKNCSTDLSKDGPTAHCKWWSWSNQQHNAGILYKVFITYITIRAYLSHNAMHHYQSISQYIYSIICIKYSVSYLFLKKLFISIHSITYIVYMCLYNYACVWAK